MPREDTPMPTYRSRTSTAGRNMAGARALWRATGMKDGDFDKPIVVDDEAGKLRLTAILTLDSERAVVGRLEQFLPLDATATDKAIVLRRADARPGGA